MVGGMKTDRMNMRMTWDDGCTITAHPDAEVLELPMRDDVKKLGIEWLERLSMQLRPVAINEARYEFLLQSTLDYITALEGVLEGLQADPETPDEVLEEIERVLK